MIYLNPDERALERYMKTDMDKPIGMLNMLKFHERARYPSDRPEPPATGAEAYARYGADVAKIAGEFGMRLMAAGDIALLGPKGEWDQVFVVYYPRRQLLIDLTSDPRYGEIVHHRQAAIRDSRLIALEIADTPIV